MSFGLLNTSLVGLYLLGNLLLGARLSRRVGTARDYYLGDGSAPWWAIGVSVLATYVSALSFLGGPAWAYGDGLAALIIHINYPLVVLVCVAVFLPFFYHSGSASIYAYVESRFGVGARTVMSVLFLVTQSLTSASILAATALVIGFATPIPFAHAVWGMAGVVVVYTLLGGMNAVIWTDVLQAGILLVGAGAVLVALLTQLDLADAARELAEAGKLDPLDWTLTLAEPNTVWAGVLAMSLFHITVYGTNQMMAQRALAARSLADAKKSYLVMGYAAVFIYAAFFAIGALLWVWFRGEPFADTNTVILRFTQTLAVPGLLGLVAAAILSASMSSLSSAFNSLATIATTDLLKRFAVPGLGVRAELLTSRLFTVAFALMVVPLAFLFDGGDSLLKSISQVGSYLVGAKLAVFGMGFFARDVSERGLLIGVAAGFAALLVLVGLGGLWGVEGLGADIAWPWYGVVGAGVNIAVAWVATRLLDGRQSWHPLSVPGQRAVFAQSGAPERVDGWWQVPGRLEPAVWGLLGVFALVMVVLAIVGGLA